MRIPFFRPRYREGSGKARGEEVRHHTQSTGGTGAQGGMSNTTGGGNVFLDLGYPEDEAINNNRSPEANSTNRGHYPGARLDSTESG